MRAQGDVALPDPAGVAGEGDARRLRVLQIVLDLHEGGLERVVPDIVRRLPPDRFESHVLALKYLGRNADGLEAFARLHVYGRRSRWSMLWPKDLTLEIGRIAPDVVHTHSGVWYKASLAARRARVPWIIHTDHGRQRPDPWQSRVLDGLASRRTDVVVAVSDALGRQMAATVVGDPTRIRVIPNGVDTEAFRPRPDTGTLRACLGLPRDALVIGSIGRLDPIKCYDVMIEAFARLRTGWTGVPVHLVLAGDGPERDRLAALVRERGLERDAHLLGWRNDIHDLHSAFALFTLSSWSEGTSISLLEAMAAGVCPVATDVGGNGAVLGPQLRHRLVPPHDAAALAEAWSAALCEPSRRDADGVTARERVRREFGVGAMVAQYQRLYLGGPRTGSEVPPQ